MTLHSLFSPSKPNTYYPIPFSLFKFMAFKKLLDIYKIHKKQPVQFV